MIYNNSDTTDVLDVIWATVPFAKTNINQCKGIAIVFYNEGATLPCAEYYVCTAYHQPGMLEVTMRHVNSDEAEITYVDEGDSGLRDFMDLLPTEFKYSKLSFSLFKLDSTTGNVTKAMELADVKINLKMFA